MALLNRMTRISYPRIFRALLVLGMSLPCAGMAATAPVEYAVKAAYLTKFGIYVDWPATGPAEVLNLCVVGEDPFGKALDSAASSQQPGNRPLAIKRMKEITPASGCHIAYFASADPTVPHAIEQLRGSPVLTVTDAPGKGAVVNFVVRDNRVRFEIDEAAAAQNNLTVSAKLLGLALNVKPRQQP